MEKNQVQKLSFEWTKYSTAPISTLKRSFAKVCTKDLALRILLSQRKRLEFELSNRSLQPLRLNAYNYQYLNLTIKVQHCFMSLSLWEQHMLNKVAPHRWLMGY